MPYADEHEGWSFYKWLNDKKQDKDIKKFKMNTAQVEVFMALLKAEDIKKNTGFSCYGINSYMRWFDYFLYTDMYSEIFDMGDLVNSVHIIGFSMKKYLINLNQRLNSLVAEKNRCEALAEPIPNGVRKQNMNKLDSEMIYGNTIFLSDQDVTLFNHIITESVLQLLTSRSDSLNSKIAQEGAHVYDGIFKEYLNMNLDKILSKFTFKQYVNFACELYN